MRSLLAVLALASVLPEFACAQDGVVTVPFVGCPADGQVGPIAPPSGPSQVVRLDRATALQLAYFKGENARGVFAPRGWHCQVKYGSSGSSIVVSPVKINSGNFEPLNLHDHAVEFVFLDGGTSGRFAVAKYAARLFPTVAASFVKRVKSEGIEPTADFEIGPYLNDSIRYSDSLSLEFITPAMKVGIGTEGDLASSQDPIRGFVVLDSTGDWGLSLLRVRVGVDTAQLAAAIIRLNRQCLSSERC